MTLALIAFGANLGDARARLDEAVGRIGDHPKIEVVAVAEPLVTTAVSGEQDGSKDGSKDGIGVVPDYLNSAILIDTTLTAEMLFQWTSSLENQMGRQRKQRWGSRTIDLDIILYRSQVIDVPQLQIPHPRMSFRKFVIDPASEIAGELVDPISGVSLKDLADRLKQSRQAILWITGDEAGSAKAGSAQAGSAQAGAIQTAADPKASRWEMRTVASIEEVEAPLEDFRLMLFSDPQGNFQDTAIRFAGPWLNLTRIEQSQWAREIRAAMQAMG